MSIRYVCFDCGEKLNLSGFEAVNEVGRKQCDSCGDNQNRLYVVDTIKYNKGVNRHNKRVLKRLKKEKEGKVDNRVVKIGKDFGFGGI